MNFAEVACRLPLTYEYREIDMSVTEEPLKSDQILSEIKRLREQAKIMDGEETGVKLVIFSLSGDYYAFYGHEVREILPGGDIAWVPGAPAFMPGLINVRGDIESVVDIRGFLGLPESAVPNRMIALASCGSVNSGVLIDEMVDLLEILPSLIKPPLATLDGNVRELIAGELEYKGRNVTLLDLGKIFLKITL